MWNLFKKDNNENKVVIIEEPKLITKNKTTNEIIEEIHESFYTEVDKLLASAKILKSTDTQLEDLIKKAERLKSLGFTNTKECKEAQIEIDRLQSIKDENIAKKDLHEAINYFSQKYPLYKFITEESVVKICNKYGLVYGTVDRYLGTVPDKNLKEINSFKIKDEDICCVIYNTNHFGHVPYVRSNKTINKYITKTEYINNSKKTEIDYYMNRRYSEIPLEIAAPQKDFNMEGYEIEDSKLVLKKVEIPDPVVLRPVVYNSKKYYLIITAWGDEASDELVVNQKFN